MANVGVATNTALHGLRLVIVHEHATVRKHLTRLLTGEGAIVTAITRAEIATARPGADVVFLADPTGDRAFTEVIALGRRCFPDGWLLAAYTEQGTQQLAPLIRAGADDVIRVPCIGVDELRVRITASRRHARRSSERAHDWSGSGEQTAKRAWAAIPDTFTREFSSFAGQQFALACPLTTDRDVTVEIPVTLGRDRLEVLVQVYLSERSARALCVTMLGIEDADRAVIDDLARESANTLAGAYKRAVEMDGVDATIGLPRPMRGVARPSTAIHSFCLCEGEIVVGFDCLLCPTEDLTITASSLREGMVVVKEVRAAGGALLIPAGTRLTATTAARLASHLGPTASVTVALAA